MKVKKTKPRNPTDLDPERELAYAIAEVIHAERTRQGVSQAELAERIGTKQPNVSRMEGANTLPTLPVLLRVAEALGVTLVVRFENTEGDQPE